MMSDITLGTAFDFDREKTKIAFDMKKVVAAVAVTVIAAAIIKKVRSSKKNKRQPGHSRHLHTGSREEAYFKLGKKTGSESPHYA